ncbi:hypothetical protein GALMADRAFT_135719 [Galerina marginata CBS 339.88]|uniref:DUF1753-domain-containing protein n=1 Tax=Galerina marginata (strain CBS 339.88) TaxID=685588 RepID=A0A067TNP1_GALM3|nr:hypothetical protein GALMADRAFT_135719 [Galerina marginata CBS 339.88]
MKLMLRPEWRLWPLSSFLGLLDLKTGVTVALLFALLNKVAGVYGLIAVLTGAGGSFAQLSLYIYSVAALAAIAWGMRVEDPKKTFYFAHLFFADHIFSTSWTIFFAVGWWLWHPHDGRRQANSAAQEAVMKLGNSTAPHLTQEQRKVAAMAIWNQEKGMAAAVIVVSWMFKIYFALLIYSYAMHLRKGSYRSLPLSRSAYVASGVGSHSAAYDALVDEEDEEIEDFYRVPLRTPPASGHRRGGSSNNNGSVTNFADFVSAPGRTPRKKNFGSVHLARDRGIEEEEVLFDEDDLTYAASTSSRAHSKLGTDSSTTAASDEERGMGGYSSDAGKVKSTRTD